VLILYYRRRCELGFLKFSKGNRTIVLSLLIPISPFLVAQYFIAHSPFRTFLSLIRPGYSPTGKLVQDFILE